jgi:hypothetical protein
MDCLGGGNGKVKGSRGLQGQRDYWGALTTPCPGRQKSRRKSRWRADRVQDKGRSTEYERDKGGEEHAYTTYLSFAVLLNVPGQQAPKGKLTPCCSFFPSSSFCNCYRHHIYSRDRRLVRVCETASLSLGCPAGTVTLEWARLRLSVLLPMTFGWLPRG